MKKLRDLTVLLTAAGSPSAPGLVKCLKNNGERNIRIIGADMCADATIKDYVDAVYKVGAVFEEDYVEELFQICKTEKVDVLIPGISAELVKLAKNRKKFEEIGTVVSVSNEESLSIANNKLNLYEFMKKEGLPVCKFCAVRTLSELDSAFAYIGYPQTAVCIKATESSGSRGVRIVDPRKSRFDLLFNEKPNSFFISYEELKEILSEKASMPEMLVMEYLPGCEYTVDLLAENGKTLYIGGRRNVESNMSIAMRSILEKKEDAYALCEKIVALLGLDGNIGFDFMLDANDKPVLTDLNPRLTATLSVFAAGGLNLLYLRVKQLLKEPLPEIQIKYGTTLKRRYLESYTNPDGEIIKF